MDLVSIEEVEITAVSASWCRQKVSISTSLSAGGRVPSVRLYDVMLRLK